MHIHFKSGALLRYNKNSGRQEMNMKQTLRCKKARKCSVLEQEQACACIQSSFSLKENMTELHPSALDVTSFLLYKEDELIGYAGVFPWMVELGNAPVRIAALTCFCIKPNHHKQGYGRYLLTEITAWIQNSGVDFGLFTCSPDKTAFYTRSEKWQVIDMRLLSGMKIHYDSKKLHLSVLCLPVVMCLSEIKKKLIGKEIKLNLPEGMFI